MRVGRTRGCRAILLASFVIAASTPRVALAAPPPTPADDNTQMSPSERIAKRANELYQQGQYHDAIAAYEQASRLDPNAPVLVRNIAVLHEKLGEVDQALSYFRKYGQMDITPDDRKRN